MGKISGTCWSDLEQGDRAGQERMHVRSAGSAVFSRSGSDGTCDEV